MSQQLVVAWVEYAVATWVGTQTANLISSSAFGQLPLGAASLRQPRKLVLFEIGDTA